MCKGLRCWTLRRRWWGGRVGERGEDTREWRRTSALYLINQPGSGPAGFPASTFPPLPLPLSSRMEAQGCGSSPAPRHRQGRPRIPGAKGLITAAHRSEHPGAMEARLGGDRSSSKRLPSSQEANNRFMFLPRWTSLRFAVGGSGGTLGAQPGRRHRRAAQPAAEPLASTSPLKSSGSSTHFCIELNHNHFWESNAEMSQ